MYSILRPLEVGYELDLQEATRHLWEVMGIAMESTRMLADVVRGLKVNSPPAVSRDLSAFPPVTAAETAEKLSLEESIPPFRQAHRAVAESIKKREFRGGLDPPAAVVRGGSAPWALLQP